MFGVNWKDLQNNPPQVGGDIPALPTLNPGKNGVIRFKKLVREPRETQFINPEIENPHELLKQLGYIREKKNVPSVEKLKEAAAKAKDAVSGYSSTNGARKAVEAIAEGLESVANEGVIQ